MSQPENPAWNVIVVTVDTLRTAFLGCYGNDWIRTPNIDRLAAEGLRFTRAHPESLPTIPMRRAVHGGRRAFPFPEYSPVPWDNVYLPGWQPLSPDEHTVAEALVDRGYHTGFFADVPHYFVPGMNFTRGFQQWGFVRGQSEDRYRAHARADAALMGRYLAPEERIHAHLVNVQPEQPEETWPTARTFRSAIQFLEDNTDNEPFYLFVDSFTPHETWEAPLHYYDLYGTRAEREPIPLVVPYGPLAQNPHIEERLPSLRANYAGLVTMVDTWFGRLLDTVDRLSLRERTLVVLVADHGTNFADNAEGVTGKPADYMYPGTMDVPLILRHPRGLGAGQTCDELVYSVDVPATVVAGAGANLAGELHGQSLLPLAEGDGGFTPRPYLTGRYGNSVWYRDDQSWLFGGLVKEKAWFREATALTGARLFDLHSDPECQHNIAARAPERVASAWKRIQDDAAGRLHPYVRQAATDAIGRPQFMQ